MRSAHRSSAVLSPAKFACLLAAWLCGAGVAFGQDRPVEFRARFDQWIAEGERQQIPWDIAVSAPELRMDQRLGLTAKVSLGDKDLNRHGTEHDLVLMARIAPSGSDWLPGMALLTQSLEKPLSNRTNLEFHLQILAKPGKYRLGIVLWDRVSGDRSVTIGAIRVEPLESDPLPRSFAKLPAAEFIPALEGLDVAFLPGMRGRLWLPVESSRKVQIELLVNFSHTEEFRFPVVNDPRFPSGPFGLPRRWPSPRRRSGPNLEDNLKLVLAALKPLSELSSPDGLRVTGLDLMRRRVVFDQQGAAPLDWPRLREGLSDMNSNVVSADALLGQTEGAEFLRQTLHLRMEAGATAGGPAEQATAEKRPLRVFILLSSSTLFPDGTDLTPIEPVPSCNCRFYFIRLRVFGNLWDDLDRILQPLKTRRFDIRSPQDYRRALAAILDDLREL